MAKHLISSVARLVYRVPLIGIRFRLFLESRIGSGIHPSRSQWNESLTGWAISYLGGTFGNDIRDSITLMLAKRLAPTASSLLDLGCAGATLARGLGPEFQCYSGVDISDVAIAKAREHLSQAARGSTLKYDLCIAKIQDYQPSRRFDIIIFNEVLYYLPLAQLAVTIRRYVGFLQPGGLVVVSLKDHELCRFIQSVLFEELKFEHSVLFQQQPRIPRWKTTRNAETPAFLVQAFRARG
jgi:2-polyprenyl-3-methyl-5-hydroxy-6-metoxy-1,4-benzoquinol methylase